jgi:hypothetical protein
MPRPSLVEKEGRPVKEWQLSPAELRRRVAVATSEARRFSKTFEVATASEDPTFRATRRSSEDPADVLPQAVAVFLQDRLSAALSGA